MTTPSLDIQAENIASALRRVKTGKNIGLFRRVGVVTAERVETDVNGLLTAIDMIVEDLRQDRRFRDVKGTERVVLERRGTRFFIVEAPAWMSVDDFGPLGMRAARKAGWLIAEDND